MIFLCNPNNPTGDNLPPEAVAAFLDRVPDHVLVVLDEAYIDFVDEEVRFDGVARLRAGMDSPQPAAELAQVIEPILLDSSSDTFNLPWEQIRLRAFNFDYSTSGEFEKCIAYYYYPHTVEL